MADDLESDDERIEAILRSMTDSDLELERPPEAVWAGIEAGIRSDRAPDTADLAPVVDLASRRRTSIMIGAVAAGLVLIAAVAVVALRGDDGPSYEVIGEADLVWTDSPEFVPEGADASATTQLLSDGEERLVRFDRSALPTPPEGEDIEVWLIGVEDDQFVSVEPIGLVDDPTSPGSYTVPADYDLDRFDTVLVDLSFEPRDGVEGHSGRSVIRGAVT